MLSGDTAVAAVQALADIDKYINLTTYTARCGCGCDNTVVELYRTDPSKQGVAYAVAAGAGDSVFAAIIAAHAQLLKAIDDHDQRCEEIASLEMLLHESD